MVICNKVLVVCNQNYKLLNIKGLKVFGRGFFEGFLKTFHKIGGCTETNGVSHFAYGKIRGLEDL